MSSQRKIGRLVALAKKPKVSHRHHAWCCEDGICVPAQLHDDFQRQLGSKLAEFDLFRWYEDRTRQRKAEMIVVGDIWTQWREEFQVEIAFRGWYTPKVRKPAAQVPVQTERLQRLSATFGRTKEETQRQLKEMLDYRQRQTKDAT